MLTTEQRRAGALKAWETMRAKGYIKGKKPAAELEAAVAKAKETASEIMETAEDKNTRFGLERDLQIALRENIEQLEAGLTIIDGGREKTGSSGRMDILAMDADKKTVVIELKVGTANQEVIGQILAYMGDLMAETKEPVRGIIVAHDFDSKVIAASKPVPNIELRKYGFNFSFKKV